MTVTAEKSNKIDLIVFEIPRVQSKRCFLAGRVAHRLSTRSFEAVEGSP